MAVPLTGSPSLSIAKVKAIGAALGVVSTVGFYLYGPAVTPFLHASAVNVCNETVGGNYRSYRLAWVVGARPHWSCRDASRPSDQPVNLGWWVR